MPLPPREPPTALRAPTHGGRALLLAALAGVMLALAAPPANRPLAAVAFVPLLYGALRAGPLRAGRGFALGLVAGAVFSLVALTWAVPLVERYGGLPWPVAVGAYLALALVEGLPVAVGAGLAAAVGGRGLYWVLPLSLASALSVVPVIFPYRPGHMLLPWTSLVQVVDLGGLGLLDLVVGLAGTGVVSTAMDRRATPLVVGSVALGLALGYGALRAPQVESVRAAAAPFRVGVVQPNITIEEGQDSALDETRLGRLRAMTRALEARGVDVVLWPEAAYPFELDRGVRADRLGPSRILRDGVRGPVVFGAMTAGQGCERWNSVLVLDRKGRIVDQADKIELFPFAEYVPLWGIVPGLEGHFPCRGLIAGEVTPLLEIAGARLGLLNCYEDVTARYALALAPHAPELLVGSASDAWYGDSAQPALHRRVATFRAIELRRDFVRALNTGQSSFVTATGREVTVLGTGQRGVFVAELRRLQGKTVYATLGEWVSSLAAAALLALTLRRAAARRARRGQAW